MATTEEIIKAAKDLGKLIRTHKAAEKFEQAVKAIEADTDAQRILTDYQRQVQAVADKQANHQPVEVEDKQKLEKLQQQVVRNKVLRDFQTAQMDYMDLMRRIDEAMTGSAPEPAAAQSPLTNPDLTQG